MRVASSSAWWIAVVSLAACTEQAPPGVTVIAADGAPGGETAGTPLAVTSNAPTTTESPQSGPIAAGTSVVEVSCRFGEGWVSVLPASLYDSSEEFLMQALIGFATDPQFWGGLPEYARYAPHAAHRCDTSTPARFQVAPGSYYLLVGWTGRFDGGEYHDNGYLEQVNLQSGQSTSRTLDPGQMQHTWLCISCPYLLVSRDGAPVDVGRVLVDRYTRERAGTDVRAVDLDVTDGRIEIVIAEREPEITQLDAIEVRLEGRRLRPLEMPTSARTVDSRHHELSMGQSLRATFDARRWPDGRHRAEIRVTGHYVPIGPLLGHRRHEPANE